MFRPTVKGSLEEQIEQYMGTAGFDDKADFTRYCVRRELDRLREQQRAIGGDDR